MAFVSTVEKDTREIRGLHPTKVQCMYISAKFDGKTVLQLNSYGSDDRDKPGKLSQTLQFGEESAQQLYSLLQREFGFRG